MSDDANDVPDDPPSLDDIDLSEPFARLTPQEELLVRLFTSGRKAHSREELADDIGTDPEDLDEVLDTLSTTFALLTDGDDDPQFTVNPLLNLLGEFTRFHLHLDEEELEARIAECEERLVSYREETGVDTPEAYLEGMRNGDIEPLGLDQINEPYWEAREWQADEHHLEMLRLYEEWQDVIADWMSDVPFDPVDPLQHDD